MLVQPFTVTAQAVEPYVHVDNRGMVMYDGHRGVLFQGNMLPWIRETIHLLIEEKRATRHQGDHFLGGYVSEDGFTATLYGGPPDHLVSLQIEFSALSVLYDELGGRQSG